MSNLRLTQERLEVLRSQYRLRRPYAQLKYPRPKTKPEYQSIYPWLVPDETDPHFVFCAVCECRLSAKRSDLGKHEGSMKHSENAHRKAKVKQPKMEWNCNDDDEAMSSFVTMKNENDDEDDEEEDSAEADGDEADPAADDDDDEDGEGEPSLKQQRRDSESDSQHSGMLDYLPLQVSINEMPYGQLSGTGVIQPPPSTTPCRITIKKIAAPEKMPSTAAEGAAASIPTAGQSNEISSKATITPIVSTVSSMNPSPRQPQACGSRQLTVPYQLSQFSPQARQRDSLELFFDSICATVKSLPPKLATEGKIRVMQLIGELELRAIIEQEDIPANPPALDLLASAAAGVPDGPGCSQQIATVASTTK